MNVIEPAIAPPSAQLSPAQMTETPATLPTSHPANDIWSVLAGMRFVLAVIVMVGHINGIYANHDWSTWANFLSIHAAVFGFFMISGYSIAHSLEIKSDGYLQRRFHRIYWVYAAVMVYCVVPFLLIKHNIVMPVGTVIHVPGIKQLTGNLLMLQGFGFAPVETMRTNWSLSVECLYYVLALWFTRQRARTLVLLIVLSLLTAMVPYLTGRVDLGMKAPGANAVLMLWAWLCGFLYQRRPHSMAAIVLLILPGCFLMNLYYHEQASLTVVLTGVLIMNGNKAVLTDNLRRLLVYLGDVSYPLYLVHMPTAMLLWEFRHTRNSLAVVCCSLAVSVLVLHAVDFPMRRFVRSRFGRKATPFSTAQNAS